MNNSLSAPFIRRPVMTMMLTACIVVFGIIAYQALPVNDLPAVDYPVITVSVSYPGASPATMAANVATPLERQFMQIPGLDLVTSQSTQGSTGFTLQFKLSKSVDAAATDVATAINQAANNLPVDLPSPPTLSKFNPNDQPIMFLALSSYTLTEGQLYDYGSTVVGQRISILPGVAKVDVFGTRSAVRVKTDPSLLAARGMTMDDLANAIRAGTSYQGAGQFDGRQRTFLLQAQGQLMSAEDYKKLIIGRKNGATIYLKDVADVRDSVQDERMERHFWMRNTPPPATNVVLAVSRQAGANAVATAQAIKDLLPQFRRELPGSIMLVPMFDRSITIVNSVNDVKETLLIAFALVVIVIFVFLGRAVDTLIPVVALPMSMLITFLAMYLLGYSLDNLSLLALTLSIGFLVDDAIVFLENTVRRMEAGETLQEATFHGAQEISFTILSMTLSLAAVFIPLTIMPGLIGRTFQEFAVTIIVAIVASGVVSLTLTPLMCARMLHSHASGKKTWVEAHVHRILEAVIKSYGNSLHFFLRHKWLSVLGWVVCMVGTVVLFQKVPKSFLPIGDSGFIRGIVMTQEGSSPDRMHEFQYKLDKILHENPSVHIGYTISGLTGRISTSQALTLAFLEPASKRPPIETVMQQLSTEMAKIPGVVPMMQANPVLQISTGAMASTQGKFSYALSGINADEVYAAADALIERLRQYPGFAFVNPDLRMHTPNLRIEILRDQAATYGVSAQSILSTLKNAYAQNYVYLIKKATDQYQVIMEVGDGQRAQPANLDLLYTKSDDGKTMVPLKAVARWTEELGPQSINHINQFPSVTIFFSLVPGAVIGDATKFVEQTAAQVLPPSVRGTLLGEAQVFKETVMSLGVLMLFAVFAMYVILGILYESYLHPITVLTSLPVATVGGLATLVIFKQDLSLYAQVGLFLLIGIVKKNGIMVVDFALQRMAEGMDRVSAIHEACLERFRPIMMTTFAALMGALPLALGHGADGRSRQPLGLIIVGGLIVSQLVTLYITPALFLIFEWLQENVLDRNSFFRSHRSTHVGIHHETDAELLVK